jgi:hypothetical protein
VVAFNEKYTHLNKIQSKEPPNAILLQALEELSTFIVKLNDNVLQDLRLLMRFEHGREKCLLILKKHIIPKIYGPLFQLYIKVNSESDKKLYQKISQLLPIASTEYIDIKPKFRLTDAGTPKSTLSLAPKIPPIVPSPKTLNNTITARRQLSTPTALNIPKQSSKPTININNQPLNLSNQNTSSSSSNHHKIPENNHSNHKIDFDNNTESQELKAAPYIMAIQEFDRMLDYTDVYDKLNCLILVRHYIQDSIIAYWKKKRSIQSR